MGKARRSAQPKIGLGSTRAGRASTGAEVDDRERDEAEDDDGDGHVEERDPHPVQRRHESQRRKTLFRSGLGMRHAPSGQWPEDVDDPWNADDVGLEGECEHRHHRRGEPRGAVDEPPEHGE